MIRKHIARALRAESRSAQLQVHRPAGQPEAEGAPAEIATAINGSTHCQPCGIHFTARY